MQEEYNRNEKKNQRKNSEASFDFPGVLWCLQKVRGCARACLRDMEDAERSTSTPKGKKVYHGAAKKKSHGARVMESLDRPKGRRKKTWAFLLPER